tara:strand:+ start:7395 stop:8180 length:786 start_codon:yes stop_codon:yes gene_type:complete
MSVTRTKRCDPCGTRATSNRSRYCTNCTQYFRPRGVSDFDWLFWTEINKAGRHNVSLSQELQDSVIHGADINVEIYGQTGLMVAIKKGNNLIVQFLVGIQELNINSQGRHNTNPLLIAARYRPDVLATLLSVPTINVNCRTNASGFQGMTPIMIAVHFNKQTNVRLLLQKGVDLTLTDIRGKTALTMSFHHPYERGAQNIVRAWFTRVTSVLNRLRYKTRRKRRRREKGLARYVSRKKNLPDDIEGEIKQRLHHRFDHLTF